MIATDAGRRACRLMNNLGASRTPFLFIIDFDQNEPIVIPLSAVGPAEIRYDICGIANVKAPEPPPERFEFRRFPISFERYLKAFETVHRNFVLGNTFLLNLTFPTPIETSLTLEQMFRFSRARYRLWVKDRFVVMSPETFVRVRSGSISSFPMKGTIDASVPDAREVILADPKELAEHVTIVDLIRNDLGMISSRVRVRRFRYVERLVTSENELLQVSSEIAGDLSAGYESRIGSILFAMLPAGSITGAPKPKTCEIIRVAEGYERGYYTGVFGCFDGRDLDSAVMIRFVETADRGLLFKSGGGLTVYSDPAREYQELIDKVYLAFPRTRVGVRAGVG